MIPTALIGVLAYLVLCKQEKEIKILASISDKLVCRSITENEIFQVESTY